MKIITHEDIMKLKISPKQCYEWVDEIIKEQDMVILPAKISLKPQKDIFYNVMPSILLNQKMCGTKIATRYPKRDPSVDSQIILCDLESGRTTAVLDGNFITTMRTGAVAAHSIKLFAKTDFRDIAIIGLGNVSRATLDVLLAIYPEKNLNVKLLKYKNQHLVFAERFQKYTNITFEAYSNIEELISDSDVIISAATYFEDDVCDNKYFKKGCLLVPIHTRGFTNCDLVFDKVFADSTEHVKGFKYFSKFKKYTEVKNVILKKVDGRVNDEERIIAYNIGISIHDIYFATRISDMITNFKEVDLMPPKEKFWI